MRLQIDWASLIVRSKFTVFALFYFVFEGNFPSTSPRGAYIWRGLFSEFYGISKRNILFPTCKISLASFVSIFPVIAALDRLLGSSRSFLKVGPCFQD